jgi:hypothetical protein
MRDRHWKMLMQATGKVFVMDARFALGDLLALELHNYVDACSEIVDRRAPPLCRPTARLLEPARLPCLLAFNRAPLRLKLLSTPLALRQRLL